VLVFTVLALLAVLLVVPVSVTNVSLQDMDAKPLRTTKQVKLTRLRMGASTVSYLFSDKRMFKVCQGCFQWSLRATLSKDLSPLCRKCRDYVTKRNQSA